MSRGQKHAKYSATMRHGVSGRELAPFPVDRGLSTPLQNVLDSESGVRLMDMTLAELDIYFGRLILLVEFEGEVQ